ncbi:MAG TPA: hypothetical protein VM891_10130, partial [Amaricoccus sp.]|nr:hypothetical protein [Amaricoccus sp.]
MSIIACAASSDGTSPFAAAFSFAMTSGLAVSSSRSSSDTATSGGTPVSAISSSASSADMPSAPNV